MHWTLFMLDSDPASDYMYTFPDGALQNRRDGLIDTPEMYAPLVKNGIERAFRLLTLTGPKFESAERRRDEVELLGVDGKTDLLPGIFPKPLFQQGKYEQKFMLCGGNSDAEHIGLDRPEAWEAYLSRLRDFINAAMGPMRIVTSTDPGFFRRGNCFVNVTDLKDYRALITITAKTEPYKCERYDSTEPWIWDDFSFVDGIIRDYGEITVTHGVGEYMTFSIPVRGRDCTPKFKRVTASDADSAVQVSIDGTNWYDAAFENYAAIDDIVLTGGRLFGESRDLYIRGNGKKISIKMRGESL